MMCVFVIEDDRASYLHKLCWCICRSSPSSDSNSFDICSGSLFDKVLLSEVRVAISIICRFWAITASLVVLRGKVWREGNLIPHV